MRRLAVGVTYMSIVVAGLAAGCGDNKPSGGHGGAGGGGAGGAGGSGSGPTCTISKPVITATHPALNGVPIANGGDEVSSPGGTYEVAFEVTTIVEDGQPVSLTVTNSATTATAALNTVAAAGAGNVVLVTAAALSGLTALNGAGSNLDMTLATQAVTLNQTTQANLLYFRTGTAQGASTSATVDVYVFGDVLP